MKDSSMLFDKENPAILEEEKEPIEKSEEDLLIQDITPGDSLYLDVAEDFAEPNENVIISSKMVEPHVQVTGKEKEFGTVQNDIKGEQEKKEQLDFIKKGIYPPDTDSQSGLKYLKYGDKCRFTLHFDNDKMEVCLHSDGFATRQLYLQNEPSLDGKAEVFRVVPRSYYDALLLLRKKLKGLEEGEQKIDITKEINNEIKSTKALYEEKKGTPVRYREPIQLIHEATQQYLGVTSNVEMSDKTIKEKDSKSEREIEHIKSSKVKKDIMRVYGLKLFAYSSANTHFVFDPCHEYQAAGLILEQDSFYLGYRDNKLLEKQFHLFFPFKDMKETQIKTFNAYLYQEMKSPIKYEKINENYLQSHLFETLHNKGIWITHIEAPLFLCLEKVESSSEQDDMDLNSLIVVTGEAMSQGFNLSFKQFDPSEALSSNGLWIVTACNDDPGKIYLKHIHYDVWIKPLMAKKVVRGTKTDTKISNGSIFSLSAVNQIGRISINKATLSKANQDHEFNKGISELSSFEDYPSHFKVVQAKDDEFIRYSMFASLNRFLRSYDEQSLRKTYDFTPETVHLILNRVLNCLKNLCLNRLPSSISKEVPYMCPNPDVQRLFRESGCIDIIGFLLLKLFPAGASGDYQNDSKKAKILGKLLLLISIQVKHNKRNQIYTFNKVISTIQKYIGLHLDKRQEHKALLSVIENCEEILLDLSLEQIINQFLRELAVDIFSVQMKKFDILNILRNFCVFKQKGIPEMQNLLHNILFETEKGKKIFLDFKFNEKNEMIFKIENGKEVFLSDWPKSEFKESVLNYFKYQLFLLADICYKNQRIINLIKGWFPISGVIKNLKDENVDMTVKIGLARILTSLFEGSENLMFISKPKLQQLWDEGRIARGEVASYMSSTDLETMKEIIDNDLKEKSDVKDVSLHYEYVRFLSYLIRCDFIFGKLESMKEWDIQLRSAYNLIYSAFGFSCKFLTNIHEDTIKKVMEEEESKNDTDPDENTQISKIKNTSMKEQEFAAFPYFLKYPNNFLYIYRSKMQKEYRKEAMEERELLTVDLMQEEICNFLVEINLLIQDVYVSAFKSVFKKYYEIDRTNCSTHCTEFIYRLLIKEQDPLNSIPELEEALKFKDLSQLFQQYSIDTRQEDNDGLMKLLIKQLIRAKDPQLESSILNAMIGYQLPKSEFIGNLVNFYIIQDKESQKKYELLSRLRPNMSDCLNQLASWLNVSDIKTLQQAKLFLDKWKEYVTELYLLFNLSAEKTDSTYKKEEAIVFSPDINFTSMFLQSKAYSIIINFLKLVSKTKLEAAENVLVGNESLGLHAVTFSRELLSSIEYCNKVLTICCNNSEKAQKKLLKYISRITIIPPPAEEERNEKWQLFSELLASDIELISAMTYKNNQIAYLRNQEIRYLSQLMTDLNGCICYYNIEKIFKIFENVLDETTNEDLYNLILSYLWVNKKRINISEILEFNSETSDLMIKKMIQLLKVTLLMGKSPELRKAKKKLREIFYIEFLPIAFPKLKHIFLDKENQNILELLKLILENYCEMYLRGKEGSYYIFLKFKSFFIDQDTAFKNEEVSTEGQLELVKAIYSCYFQYTNWIAEMGYKNTERASELYSGCLFKEKLNDIRIQFKKITNPDSSPFCQAYYRLFGKNDEPSHTDFPQIPNVIQEDKLKQEKTLFEYLKDTKESIVNDTRVVKEVRSEFQTFCRKLLSYILDIKDPINRQFLTKLISYIGACGENIYINIHTIKYLLTAFIKVIDMSEDMGEGEKEKKRSQKKVLSSLDDLKLTKTLLNLLCSESSEGLTSIIPLLLKLSNKMLTGAIRKIQDQFFDEFESNPVSERFFGRMESLISRNVFVYYRHYKRFGMDSKEQQGKWKAVVNIPSLPYILKLIQSLCENHHEKLQHYIVKQYNSRKNHNMIRVIVFYLEVLVKEIRINLPDKKLKAHFNEKAEDPNKVLRMKISYKHSILAFKALTELVQGPCCSNQEEIANSPFFKIAAEILSIPFNFEECNMESECLLDNFQISMLKKECATLLISLMEQRTSNDVLVTKMRLIINDQHLMNNICYIYYAFKKEADAAYTEELLFDPIEKKQPTNKSVFILELGFTLLFICKKWMESKNNFESILQKYMDEMTDHVVKNVSEDMMLSSTTTFFKDLIFGFVYLCKQAVIKAELKDSEFEKLRKDEAFQRESLNFFNKNTGIIEIVRNGQTEKVSFPILPYAEALQEDQKTSWLNKMPVGKPRAKLDYLTNEAQDFLQQLKNEYLFSRIFRYYPVFGALTKQIPLWKTINFYITLIINILIIFSYRKQGKGYDNLIDDPQLFDRASEDTTKKILIVVGSFLTLFSGIVVTSFLFKFTLSTYYHLKLELEQKEGSEEEKDEKLAKAKIAAKLIWSICTNVELIYNVAHLALALCGCIVHPLFFTFHILSVAFRSKRLQSVLEAIMGQLESLLLTLFLYFVMSYLFTIIGYIVFPEQYPDFACHSLISCFLFHIDSAFKSDGGTVSVLTPIYTADNDNETISLNYFRFIYDFLYNFILLIIIVQLLGGLIIDKFRSLRAEQERTEEDLQSFCVICSDSSENIERKSGNSFLHHTVNIHNTWLYILFIGYLLRKPKLEFSGIESYVYENYKNRTIYWLPYSLWEIKGNNEEKDNIDTRLKSVSDKIIHKANRNPTLQKDTSP